MPAPLTPSSSSGSTDRRPAADSPRGLSRRMALAAVPGIALGAGALAAPTSAAPASNAPTEAVDVTSVMYVEVNSNDLSVVGDYSLADSGAPVFDVAVIFAANINYDGTAAYLHLNERVTATLEDAENQIRPLQARGIKVILSILGNHQGAGFANFPDAASARAFAQELADVVDAYDLDGIDFDDEWAKYGENGTGAPNDHSFVELVTATRELLGEDRLLTFYKIGESGERLEHDGVSVGESFDFAYNPYYGTWSVPTVPGMTNAQYSPAAVDIYETSASTITSFAERTVAGGYGAFLCYNLGSQDATAQISAFSRPLYGEAAVRSV